MSLLVLIGADVSFFVAAVVAADAGSTATALLSFCGTFIIFYGAICSKLRRSGELVGGNGGESKNDVAKGGRDGATMRWRFPPN